VLGDNLLIRGDGAGKGVQNSGITITDANAMSGGSSVDVSGDYQISSTSVLNATTLGSGVTASSLTSVGTVTSGTWSATDVAVDAGGSGRSSATAYAVICGGTTGTGAHQSIAGLGTSGQLLTSGGAGALPSFTSPAPESLTTALTAGSVVFSDGSNLAQDNSNFFWDDTNNRLGLGTTTPLDTLHVVGNMDLVHTAAENDDHAFEIDCDAAGFGDVKALDILYTTGAVAATEDEEAILINIDETLSTGGEVVGVQVLTTTEGSAAIIASKCGPGVDAIRQETGTFGNMDSALNKAVDVLAALSSGGAGNISLFVADNDTFTIGDAATFGAMEIIVDTGASGAGIAPTFEYSTGVDTWATFSPADGTNGFRNTGVIAWNVNDLSGFAVGTGSEYLIRITRTRNTLATTPIVDEVQIAALTEFKWDLNGDVNLNSLTLATDLAVAEGGTGASTLLDNGVLVGSGTGAITALTVGTNGQLLIGSTAADPVFGTLTSSDSTIEFTAGAGTLSIQGAAATDTQAGVIELATDAETNTGTATNRATTPANITAWTGGTNLVTVGTIATGTWQGTVLADEYGGTGQSTFAKGDILYASAANTLAKLPIGSDNQVLVVNVDVPNWEAQAGGGDVSKVGTPVDNQIGVWTGDGTLEGDASFLWDGTGLKIEEVAAAAADTANFGQIWVKNDTPNTLWFTDDAGTDTQLGVGGGMPDFVVQWSAAALENNYTPVAPPEQDTTTNIIRKVRAFDYNTIEYADGHFEVPPDMDTTGTITFSVQWYARTVPSPSENVIWQIEHAAVATTEDQDSATFTAEVAAASATGTTQNALVRATWTETRANLGWVAGDTVYVKWSRKSTDANDTFDSAATSADDALLVNAAIIIPQA
jgi:hypothetical protein